MDFIKKNRDTISAGIQLALCSVALVFAVGNSVKGTGKKKKKGLFGKKK